MDHNYFPTQWHDVSDRLWRRMASVEAQVDRAGYMTEDEIFDLTLEVEQRYGVRLTLTEAKLLRFLMSVKTATDSAIDFEVWPEVDPFDRDITSTRRVHIHRLRKKFGRLMELVTYFGQGYALKRLGPPDNPMHERK